MELVETFRDKIPKAGTEDVISQLKNFQDLLNRHSDSLDSTLQKAKETFDIAVPIMESSPDKEVYLNSLLFVWTLEALEKNLHQIWAELSAQEARQREEIWNAFAPHYLNLCEIRSAPADPNSQVFQSLLQLANQKTVAL